MELPSLKRPPSERSSRTFGILALCSHLLCLLGAPFAVLFGILALVRHGRARREHEAARDRVAAPGNAGQVMGIVALAGLVMTLPTTGIVSAIAIPALLGQRARAREKVVQQMVVQAAGEVVRVADAQSAHARPTQEVVDGDRIIQAVLALPAFQEPLARNPYGAPGTPYRHGPVTAPGTVGLTFHAAYRSGEDPQPRPAIVVEGCVERLGQRDHPVKVTRIVHLD